MVTKNMEHKEDNRSKCLEIYSQDCYLLTFWSWATNWSRGHQFCTCPKWHQASQKAGWSDSKINCLWKRQWYLQPLELRQVICPSYLEMVIYHNLCGRSKRLWQWGQESLGPHQVWHIGVLCQNPFGLHSKFSFWWLSWSQETVFLLYLARMLSHSSS